MARRIGLSDASNYVFESRINNDVCSESSYVPDREGCSISSRPTSESEHTLSESDDDTAAAQTSTSTDPFQNDPQLNAASNFIIWHQPPAYFIPKFPTHDYIPCKPTVKMPSILLEIDFFKLFFSKSLCIFIAQCTNKRIDMHNIEKNAMISLTDEGEMMIFLGVMFVMCESLISVVTGPVILRCKTNLSKMQSQEIYSSF